MLNRLYAFLAWAIVGLGLLHMLTTFQLATASATARVWFFGSGIAIALVGELNLLQRAYGHSAAGLRVVCRGATFLLFVFAAVAGAVTRAGIVQRRNIEGHIYIFDILGKRPRGRRWHFLRRGRRSYTAANRTRNHSRSHKQP